MPKKQTTDQLTPRDVAFHAYQWNREQMEEMKAIIDGLLAAQFNTVQPQVGVAPSAQSQRGPRGGSYIEQKTINGCGPYQYLRYRHEGKFRSVYVGKADGQQGDCAQG